MGPSQTKYLAVFFLPPLYLQLSQTRSAAHTLSCLLTRITTPLFVPLEPYSVLQSQRVFGITHLSILALMSDDIALAFSFFFSFLFLSYRIRGEKGVLWFKMLKAFGILGRPCTYPVDGCWFRETFFLSISLLSLFSFLISFYILSDHIPELSPLYLLFRPLSSASWTAQQFV